MVDEILNAAETKLKDELNSKNINLPDVLQINASLALTFANGVYEKLAPKDRNVFHIEFIKNLNDNLEAVNNGGD